MNPLEEDRRARILIIDDNPQIAALVQAQLERAGYQASSASSGRAGLEDVERIPPDLILLDVMMPGIDGYEVCRQLKANATSRAIPVVMLTALKEQADRIRGLEVGADDFLSKPFDRADLLARVRSLLRVKRLYDELTQSRNEIAAQAEQLAAEKSRAEAILYSMSDGVVTVDVAGQISLINPAAEAIAAVTLEAVRGRPWREALGVRDDAGQGLTDERCPVMETLRGDRPSEARNLTIWPPDRVEVAINLAAAPVRRAGGATVGVVAVFRDVTRQREANRMKEAFTALVSHELRTPTASIFGFAELLLDRESLTPEGRSWAETIYREAQGLTNLVNDFLDVERLASGRVSYHFRPVRMDHVLPLIERDLAPQLGRHRPVFDLPPDPIAVRADSDRLAQVLLNLVANAVKYSPAGGEIRIGARSTGAETIISVTDQGLGLPPEAMPKLFDRFYRVDEPEHRQIEGTGLGLAICKQIVEDMGGRIWAESRGLGQGSTFSLSLPTAAAPPLAP